MSSLSASKQLPTIHYAISLARGGYLKALYWDGTGMCLFAKRLEHGKFVWPSIVDGVLQMSAAQLALLVEGMDWRRTRMPDPLPKPAMA